MAGEWKFHQSLAQKTWTLVEGQQHIGDLAEERENLLSRRFLFCLSSPEKTGCQGFFRGDCNSYSRWPNHLRNLKECKSSELRILCSCIKFIQCDSWAWLVLRSQCLISHIEIFLILTLRETVSKLMAVGICGFSTWLLKLVCEPVARGKGVVLGLDSLMHLRW